MPWLQSNEKVSADELAIVILGHANIETPHDVEYHTLPCRDQQQRECLMACSIFQLGERSVKVKKWANQEVETDHTTMCAITLWKEECEDEWMTIVQNPFQFVRRTLNNNEAIVAMWGKSFRRNKSPCAPRDATSVQIHCSLKDDSLKKIMLESGYNRLWLTPKQQNGRPHESWKLIWLQPGVQLPETKVLGARLTSFCGISKGTNRFAIRVTESTFVANWKLIYPGSNPPEQVAADHLCKLENLPFGTTSKMVLDWAGHHKLKMRAIRALGPRAWLIGTPVQVPAQQFAFNGHPILIRPVQPRYVRTEDPVVAGPKPTHHAATSSAMPPDPWAAWKGPRLQPNQVQSPIPAVPGPTENKLQEHDARLQELTDTLSALKVQQTNQEKMFSEMKQEVKNRDTKIIGHIDHQVQSLRQEMDQSFTKALQDQSKHLDNTLQEFKQLLIANAKRKSPEVADDEM